MRIRPYTRNPRVIMLFVIPRPFAPRVLQFGATRITHVPVGIGIHQFSAEIADGVDNTIIICSGSIHNLGSSGETQSHDTL